jgi:hypothetical protein
MTQTMTQTEALRAYPDCDLPLVGYWIAVTVWTDADGEMTDMLTGAGASEQDALADAEKELVAQGADGEYETTAYLLTLPGCCPCGCGTEREERTCDECGTTAAVIDCGYYRQPAAISAMPGGRDLCDTCFAQEEQKPKTPRTAHTEWTASGGSLTVEADWADAASPITYGIDGEEPTHATVFQVADARHSANRAIEIVSDWLDRQGD